MDRGAVREPLRFERRRVAQHLRGELLGHAFGRKEKIARQEEKERRAEAVDVRANVREARAAELLGRHEVGSSDDRARLRDRAGFGRLLNESRQPEVEDLDLDRV